MNVNDTTLLKGKYTGYVVMYDWSGKHILGEKSVIMFISRTEKDFSGYIIWGTDSVPFKADMIGEVFLKFKKSYVSLNERYTSDRKVKYKLDYANLDMWKNNICGSLQLYSLSQREPERPMYMDLYRTGTENNSKQTDNITITPNPFDGQFDAIFELTEKSTVIARIFDRSGIQVWQ